MGRLKPDEEITEFPLNLEEESQSQMQDYEVHDVVRTSNLSLNNSQQKITNALSKSRSKDSLGFKDINGSSSILKAFKNSP